MGAVEILQSHGLKKSAARLAIIESLQNGNAPRSEHEVKETMGALYDRITFYRTVQTLIDAGVMHRIVIDRNTVRYALNHCDKAHQHTTDHVHFQCQDCKQIICMDALKTTTPNLPKGFSAEQCEVIVKGLCKQCNK